MNTPTYIILAENPISKYVRTLATVHHPKTIEEAREIAARHHETRPDDVTTFYPVKGGNPITYQAIDITTTLEDVFLCTTDGTCTVATEIDTEGVHGTGIYPADCQDVIYLDAEQIGDPDTLEPQYRALVKAHRTALEKEVTA